MKKILISLLTFVICLTLVGCNKKDTINNNSIVGTWEYKKDNSSIVLIFRQNNTGRYTSYLGTSALENNDFTYSANEDKITIKFSITRGEIESNYKLNGNTLTIDGIDKNAIFNRK